MFTLFSTPLADIITRFRLRFYPYVDDIQIYIAIRRDNIACVTSRLAVSTAAVYEWFLHNRIALNPDKSEATMYRTASPVQYLNGDTFITVAGAPVELSHSIQRFGVTIDENLTFDEHVRNVCKASYYHIRGLRHIRAAMSKDTACTAASAIVSSRLD